MTENTTPAVHPAFAARARGDLLAAAAQPEAPAPVSSPVESYLDEAHRLSAYGLPVLSATEAAAVSANAAGPFLLGMIKTAIWNLESADRDVRRHAALVAKYAAEVSAAVDAHLQIAGSVGGETWVTSSARDLQTAANARKAAIERIQEFTYAARQILSA